jgi:hypothetical protein
MMHSLHDTLTVLL